MQHVSKSLFGLVSLIRFILDKNAIDKEVRAFSVIARPNQFAKHFAIQGIFIVNGMKYFYFMSAFCQAFS
jgi:hypothetical protein